MKNKKILTSLSLITLLSLFSSCGEVASEKFLEYYDESWTPGANALNANQPSVKNPVGNYTVLNEIRRSQNKVGLPSKGEANILVVPINFKDDDLVQKEIGESVDITFDNNDLLKLEELYFNKKNSFGYPSVSSYYKTSSFDNLSLSGVVSPVVTLPDSYLSYVMKSSVSTKQEAMNDIIDYVYNYLFIETQTYYLGDFDSDNDKKIDAISLICNYSHSLSFQDPTIDALHSSFVGANNVFFSSDIRNLNKTPINSYSLTSDSFRKNFYLEHDSRIYINLVGQMIGLDNYEDTTVNPLTGTSRAPLSYLDTMSGALGDHNSFSKYQLGWIEPKFIKAEDIPEQGLEMTINSAVTSGDSIILYTGSKTLFGEYLMIDLYSNTKGVNAFDSVNPSAYGQILFNESAVRVYQVDSRLVKGYGSLYNLFTQEPNFDETLTLPNGVKTSYTYDYAFTNNSVNKYSQNGMKNYALVSLLSKKGLNRHMTYYNTPLTIDDMFLPGDVFGGNDQITGFYKDFSFHGNGNNNTLLNITFEVKSITKNTATLLFRRAK